MRHRHVLSNRPGTIWIAKNAIHSNRSRMKTSVLNPSFETETVVLMLVKKEWTKRSIFSIDRSILTYLLPDHRLTWVWEFMMIKETLWSRSSFPHIRFHRIFGLLTYWNVLHVLNLYFSEHRWRILNNFYGRFPFSLEKTVQSYQFARFFCTIAE